MFLGNKSLIIGGRTFDAGEVARFESGITGIILCASCVSATFLTTVWDTNQVAAMTYVVPAGKTLRVVAGRASSAGGTANQADGWWLGYSDVTRDNQVADATAKGPGGSALTTKRNIGNTVNQNAEGYLNFSVPTGKYPWVSASVNDSIVFLWCFLD